MRGDNQLLKNKRVLLCVAVSCFAFFGFYGSAYAATLYFSPSSGNYSVGGTFGVDMLVDTQGEAINNAESVATFPADRLSVVSVSRVGSIFSLWVEEPSFSNSSGVISLNGGLSTPGYNGSAGKVLSVVFRVKNSGSASLSYASAAVRANDGLGTDILRSRLSANFSLSGAAFEEAAPAPAAKPSAGTPEAPKIISSTHPDPDSWYAKVTADLSWKVGDDITSDRLLIGKSANATPTVVYKPAIDKKTLEDLDDGVWYFSAQLRNSKGWGDIARFQIQIDTHPPEPFVIKFPEGAETDNPWPVVLFNTSDSLSGIDHYRIKIGEGDFFKVSSNEIVKSNPYTLPLQAPGKRTILVQAYDKAGNYSFAAGEFIIKAIESPTIAEYPNQVESGNVFTIKGKTYPNSVVAIWFQRELESAKSQTVKSDSDGDFILISDGKFSDGQYKFWAEVTDNRGAKSAPSEKFSISIGQSLFLRVCSWAVRILAVVVPLVALIVLLVWLVLHGRNKFRIFIRKSKTSRSHGSMLYKTFELLRDDISEQIRILEEAKKERDLTKEEQQILHHLKDYLVRFEKFIDREIKKVK